MDKARLKPSQTRRTSSVFLTEGGWKPFFLLGLVLVILVLARHLHAADRILDLKEWIRSLGAWGPLVYLFIYIGAVVAALPGTAFTLLAGIVFGAGLGIVVSSLGSAAGAALCFLIARYFARRPVEKWLARNPAFKKLDRLTDEKGAAIVAFTRLVPLFPFNVLNYSFGLTRIGFWKYLFWSWLCMIPSTVLFAAGGDTLVQSLTTGRLPWKWIFVLAAATLALVLAARKLKSPFQSGRKQP